MCMMSSRYVQNQTFQQPVNSYTRQSPMRDSSLDTSHKTSSSLLIHKGDSLVLEQKYRDTNEVHETCVQQVLRGERLIILPLSFHSASWLRSARIPSCSIA